MRTPDERRDKIWWRLAITFQNKIFFVENNHKLTPLFNSGRAKKWNGNDKFIIT